MFMPYCAAVFILASSVLCASLANSFRSCLFSFSMSLMYSSSNCGPESASKLAANCLSFFESSLGSTTPTSFATRARTLVELRVFFRHRLGEFLDIVTLGLFLRQLPQHHFSSAI